jgi:curved DNA-binding protein CbpA
VTSPAAGNPFRALGLAPEAELTGDDVRAAWRRVAAATHPDRADGGDPTAFAAAAAAYTVLRTAAGRGEALADLRAERQRRAARPRRWTWPPRSARPRGLPRLRRAGGLRLLAARIRRGRPAMLAMRVAIAGAVSAVAVLAGWQPASPAIIVGVLTWLLRTGRNDLAAPPP